jgi:hypothetical protein
MKPVPTTPAFSSLISLPAIARRFLPDARREVKPGPSPADDASSKSRSIFSL